MTISVNIYRNPLSPECREQFGIQCPATLRQITIDQNGGASEWPFPTVAIVNGTPWKRGRWNEPLTDGMVVEFRSMVRSSGVGKAKNVARNIYNDPLGAGKGAFGMYFGGGGNYLAQGAYAQLTQGMTFSGMARLGATAAGWWRINKHEVNALINGNPETPSSINRESGSPTYTIDGQGNRKRVGEPIPVIYGRMRVFPDTIQDMYPYYNSTNGQVVNFVGCIGHGEFDLEGGDGAPRFGEGGVQPAGSSVWILTDLTTFSDAYAFMMPVHFTTVNNEKLTTSYVDYDIKSGYDGAGEYLSIEFDVIFPNGLYSLTVSGNMDVRSNDIDYSFKEYLGASDWAIASGDVTISSVSGDLRTPIRRTMSVSVSGHAFDSDRFIRASFKRPSAETTAFDLCEEVRVSGVRGMRKLPITPSTYTYALYSLTASESVNGDIASRFNVTVTRKLPIWDGNTWSAPTATRSIAWALADICRNADYGMGLDDSLIDLDALLALDTIWTINQDTFDGVFDQTVTAWEALQKVARCGRAIPVLVNGRVTFVRDGAKSVRSAIFNPSNIAPGSLSIQYVFRQESEPDGIELTYLNTTTWQNEIVTVAMPGVTGDPLRPQKVDLFGCTDSAQALREATYLARRMAYMRKTISWQTEMDGRLLMVGDMVAVAHDMPAWSESSECVAYYDLTTSSRWDWTEPVAPSGGDIFLAKRPDGTVWESTVSSVGTGYLIVQDVPDFTPITSLEDGERTTFNFYAVEPVDYVITDISPAGDTGATITAVPYDARIHASGA